MNFGFDLTLPTKRLPVQFRKTTKVGTSPSIIFPHPPIFLTSSTSHASYRTRLSTPFPPRMERLPCRLVQCRLMCCPSCRQPLVYIININIHNRKCKMKTRNQRTKKFTCSLSIVERIRLRHEMCSKQFFQLWVILTHFIFQHSI